MWIDKNYIAKQIPNYVTEDRNIFGGNNDISARVLPNRTYEFTNKTQTKNNNAICNKNDTIKVYFSRTHDLPYIIYLQCTIVTLSPYLGVYIYIIRYDICIRTDGKKSIKRMWIKL